MRTLPLRSKIGPAPVLAAYRRLAEAGEEPGCCAIARRLGQSHQMVGYQLTRLRVAGLIPPSRESPERAAARRRRGLMESDAAEIAARVADVRLTRGGGE